MYANIFQFTMISTLIILTVYWHGRIFAAIRKQKRQIAQQQRNINMDDQASQTQRPNHKGVITSVLLLLCFLFFFIPASSIFFFQHVLRLRFSSSVFLFLHPWAVTCVHLSSFLNPLIYGVRVRELREKCLQLFRVEI